MERPESQALKAPTCSNCGKPMRLVSSAPVTNYSNLQHAKFRCDCGRTTDAMMADKE